jgi:hypothetical protein
LAGVVSVVLIGGTCLPDALAAQRQPAVASRSWTQLASFWGIQNMWALSCPSATTCEAVGAIGSAGIAVRTTDGGVRWVNQPLPPGVSELKAVACHSPSDCVALGAYTYAEGSGSVALRTTNGGATWVAKKLPAGIESFSAVACPTASVCEALGENSTGYAGEVTRTTNGGSTWVDKSLPGVGQPLAIACPSASVCEAVAYSPRDYAMTLRTTNGGATWAEKTLPQTSVQGLVAVACQSATVCEASGTLAAVPLVVRTTNGGVTWTPEKLPTTLSDGDVAALSCPNASVCNATEANGVMRTTNSGKTWSTEVLPTGVLVGNKLSCPTVSICVAGGTLGQEVVALHTTDAGTKWASDDLPTGIAQLNAVSCRSVSVCVVGGQTSTNYGVERTTDGGINWDNQTLWYTATQPFSDEIVDSIACATEPVCVATMTSAYIVHTNDSGAKWLNATTAPASLAPQAVACLTTSVCAGVGGEAAFRTTNGGKTWVSSTLPVSAASDADLVSIACPSTSVCEAVGASESTSGGALAFRSSNGGATWSAQKLPKNIAGLTAVACATASTCEAVGASFAISSGYTVLACPGSATCPEATGSAYTPSYPYALRTTDGGARWVSTKLPTSVGDLSAIACPTPSVCDAVGAHATASTAAAALAEPAVVAVRSTDGGTTWAAQPLPAGITSLKGLACPTPYGCDAVGSDPIGGVVLRFS